MTTGQTARPGIEYLDMQAYVGITKHNGGFAATDELLTLCRIETAREVLNAGCGIGVGSAYVARNYPCHVVGVDISEKMLAWSRQRARMVGVSDKVDLRVGDVLALPFKSDRFDVVFCESVLAFVEDKGRAIAECVRVTKPGGYVGLNETYFVDKATPELTARVQTSLGTHVPSAATWQALWEKSVLCDRVVKLYRIDARTEIRDRIRWVGWRWAVRAWGRLLRLYITEPTLRQSLREMFDAPVDLLQQMGYGIFVGRKPEQA